MFWLQEVTSGAQGLKSTKGTRYMSKVRKKVLSVDVNGRRKSQRNKERTFLTLAFEIKHPTKGISRSPAAGTIFRRRERGDKMSKKKTNKKQKHQENQSTMVWSR